MKKIKVKTNLIFGLIAVVVSVTIWLLIPSQVKPSKVATEYINGSFMPKLMAVIMFVCGLICIIKSLVFKNNDDKEIEIEIELKNLIYILMVVVYGLLAKYISFLIASVLFGLGSLFFMKERGAKKYFIVTATIISIALIFKFLLKVNFSGLLGV